MGLLDDLARQAAQEAVRAAGGAARRGFTPQQNNNRGLVCPEGTKYVPAEKTPQGVLPAGCERIKEPSRTPTGSTPEKEDTGKLMTIPPVDGACKDQQFPRPVTLPDGKIGCAEPENGSSTSSAASTRQPPERIPATRQSVESSGRNPEPGWHTTPKGKMRGLKY